MFTVIWGVLASAVADSADAARDSDTLTLARYQLVGTFIVAFLAFLGVVYANNAKRQATEANIQATQANRAVNHQEPGEPPFVEITKVMAKQVNRLENRLDNNVERLDDRDNRIEQKLDLIGGRLTRYISWDQQRRWPTVDDIAAEMVRQTEWDGSERRHPNPAPYEGTERRRPSVEVPIVPDEEEPT